MGQQVWQTARELTSPDEGHKDAERTVSGLCNTEAALQKGGRFSSTQQAPVWSSPPVSATCVPCKGAASTKYRVAYLLDGHNGTYPIQDLLRNTAESS